MDIETIINQQWVVVDEETAVSPADVLIAAGRVADDALEYFRIDAQMGRVALVTICPETGNDPTLPIVVGASGALLAASRGLYAVMSKPYAEIRAAGARYIEAAAPFLNGDELAFLRQQVALCAVDPVRRFKV